MDEKYLKGSKVAANGPRGRRGCDLLQTNGAENTVDISTRVRAEVHSHPSRKATCLFGDRLWPELAGFYPEFMKGGHIPLLLHAHTIFLLKRGG